VLFPTSYWLVSQPPRADQSLAQQERDSRRTGDDTRVTEAPRRFVLV
jgi:hypothetical protein